MGRRLSKKQRHARRRGLQASAAFGVAALGTMIATVSLFDLRDEQAAGLIVLEGALALMTTRFLYLGVSRRVLPSWAIDRLSYTTESAWIDGERATISKASHLVAKKWSRGFATFVAVVWCALWVSFAIGAMALAWRERGFHADAGTGGERALVTVRRSRPEAHSAASAASPV